MSEQSERQQRKKLKKIAFELYQRPVAWVNGVLCFVTFAALHQVGKVTSLVPGVKVFRKTPQGFSPNNPSQVKVGYNTAVCPFCGTEKTVYVKGMKTCPSCGIEYEAI